MPLRTECADYQRRDQPPDKTRHVPLAPEDKGQGKMQNWAGRVLASEIDLADCRSGATDGMTSQKAP